MNFKDFSKNGLLEMSIAVQGDWNPGIKGDELKYLSKFMANSQWGEIVATKEFNREEFQIRKHRNKNSFVVGRFEEILSDLKDTKYETKFRKIAHIDLQRAKRLEKALSRLGNNYGKIVNVNGIFIDEDYRGFSVATDIYKWLVNDLGFTVMGDSKQYFGARRLWARLSNTTGFVVDLINIKDEVIIKKDVILKHGETEEEFDKRLWSISPDLSKYNVRPILRKIQ